MKLIEITTIRNLNSIYVIVEHKGKTFKVFYDMYENELWITKPEVIYQPTYYSYEEYVDLNRKCFSEFFKDILPAVYNEWNLEADQLIIKDLAD